MIPKLNDKPQYEMTIPSLNQTVRFRPYLVKEEKILMMAFESNDKVASLRAVTDTINACIDDEFKSNELKLFDIEYMFTKIRSKSVGEKVNLMITCSECEHKNEISVNIEDAKVDMPEKIEPNIKIAENVTVEMTWPIYTKMIQNNKIIDKPNEVDSILELIADCMVSISTEDNKVLLKDEPREKVIEFIESMTNEQFSKVRKFIEEMPTVYIDHEFECSSCKKHNKVTVRNITDFF